MFISIALVFLAIVLITKYVSLGSIIIMLLFVVEVVIYGQMGGFQLSGIELMEFYGIAVFLAAMACFRHRANVKRLISGTENKTDLLKMCKKG